MHEETTRAWIAGVRESLHGLSRLMGAALLWHVTHHGVGPCHGDVLLAEL